MIHNECKTFILKIFSNLLHYILFCGKVYSSVLTIYVLTIERKRRMKKVKNLLFVLCMTLCIGVFTACSNTNTDTYKNYVQSVLDTNFKGVYQDYMELTSASESQASEIYEANISAITNDVLSSGLITDPTEEDLERLRQFAITLLNKADYNVKGVEKKDGTYYVNVEIRPYIFYSTLQDKLLTKYSELSEKYQDVDIDSMSNEEYASYVAEYNEATFTLMDEVLNLNEYEESVTVACKIIVSEDYYEINSSDYETIYSTIYVPIE